MTLPETTQCQCLVTQSCVLKTIEKYMLGVSASDFDFGVRSAHLVAAGFMGVSPNGIE